MKTHVINQAYYHLYIMHDRDTWPYLAAFKTCGMCFVNCLYHSQHREPQEQDKVRPREDTFDKDPITDFLYQCGQ